MMYLFNFINRYRKLSYIPLLLIIATSASMCSCKKSSRESNISKPPVISKVDSSKIKDSIRIADSTRIADSLAAIAHKTINVGTGSGDLTIDGNNFIVNGIKRVLTNGDIIKIKGGSYSSITIKNISVPDGARVLIINDGGMIQLNGTKQMNLSNLNNVTVSGAGVSADARGLVFQDNNYRAVVLSGNVNNFTLQNVFFKNISDYVITYAGLSSRIYTGAADSYASNLAFLNIDAENTSTLIQFDGDINTTNFTGLVKNIEIANISCINSSGPGAVVYLGNAENFNIHDNFANNINAANNNHNGIFFLKGNGKFYNNRISNHQGNGLRAWIYSISGTASIEIYNNIVYNSRKYSGFEIQVPPYIYATSVFKPANAKVYNNTVGKMNTEKSSFPGRLLDVYNTYGTLEVFNNLVFSNNDNQILNNMSDTKIIRNENNTYKNNESDAIINTISFASKITGVGASL